MPPLERVTARLDASYRRGQLTNGPLVRELEATLADRLGVAHVVAVASCTAGLMLTFRALEPSGPVVLPSFTFSASAHSVAWVGARPRFIECDPASFLADLDDGRSQTEGASAFLITHVFGAPAAPEEWEKVAADAGIPLVFDAAHALGSQHRGRPVGGFGDAEVFSMSPTKPVIAGEGGIVATNREDIAGVIRIGRDYGNPGDYDTRFVGLNARMSEFHAATALESLADLDEHLETRSRLAARYCHELSGISGVRVQVLEPHDTSTWKDFTIAVDAAEFGRTRDELASELRAEGIDTRSYFDPPVHRQQSHAASADRPLPTTDRVASQVISLPLYPALETSDVDRVASVIADVGRAASTGPES
ncbi:MAG: DegT/DnrJ/EryC1/StrS family aminotransferase [Acidimicrobiia bacterium]